MAVDVLPMRYPRRHLRVDASLFERVRELPLILIAVRQKMMRGEVVRRDRQRPLIVSNGRSDAAAAVSEGRGLLGMSAKQQKLHIVGVRAESAVDLLAECQQLGDRVRIARGGHGIELSFAYRDSSPLPVVGGRGERLGLVHCRTCGAIIHGRIGVAQPEVGHGHFRIAAQGLVEGSCRLDPDIRMQVGDTLVVEPLRQRRGRRYLLVIDADALPQRYRPAQDFFGYPADSHVVRVLIGLSKDWAGNRQQKNPRSHK